MADKSIETVAPAEIAREGHGPDGRFVKGYAGGPGNPFAAAVGVWRGKLVKAVTPEAIEGVIQVLIDKALAGEGWAVREILDRCLGKPQQRMEVEAAGGQTWAMMLACLQTAGKEQAGEGGEQ